jgi:hypothetical protein
LPNADEPNPDGGDHGDEAGITRSEHARLRSKQGRPIGEVVNDIQRAGPRDFYIQTDDSRFVVRGPKGREHIVESSGEHVTSVRRPDAAHQARIDNGTIRLASAEEQRKLKAFAQ